MDIILNSLVDDDRILGKTERKLCCDLLNEVLQSETRSYEDYFSSKPVEGSVVEEIAEVDAQIAVIEKKIRTLLTENKSEVVREVLDNNGVVGDRLKNIRKELEQLWELDNVSSPHAHQKTENGKDDKDILIDEIMDQNDANDVEKEDQFQNALNILKNRVLENESGGLETSGNLVLVLENLSRTTDLMELPFLARTCIKTGHYQEAVMLYSYSKSLLVKFPGSRIIEGIYRNVLNETTTTMLTGLLRLLSTNVTVNSLKKILNYLTAIPPFDNKDKSSVLQVYLYMRYIFIQREISSYSLEVEKSNEALLEMMVKRKIEVLREYMYTSLNVFMELYECTTKELSIPLESRLKKDPFQEENEKHENEEPIHAEQSGAEQVGAEQVGAEQVGAEQVGAEQVGAEQVGAEQDREQNGVEPTEVKIQDQNEQRSAVARPVSPSTESSDDTPQAIATNPLMLQFTNACTGYLLKELSDAQLDNKLSDSVCLQLVYCSFRMHDLNLNYHHLFLNKICESNLFTTKQLQHAIERRRELASKYS